MCVGKVTFLKYFSVHEPVSDLAVTLLLSPPPIQECFNSPYGTSFFSSYAEKIPGESTQMLSEAAKENEIYLVGGRRRPLWSQKDLDLVLGWNSVSDRGDKLK